MNQLYSNSLKNQTITSEPLIHIIKIRYYSQIVKLQFR